MSVTRRKVLVLLLALLIFYLLIDHSTPAQRAARRPWPDWAVDKDPWRTKRSWANVEEKYPVKEFAHLPPIIHDVWLPKIQSRRFPIKDGAAEKTQKERLAAVKASFTHAWKGYRKYAWTKDEIAPVSGGFYETFGGWSATLIDSMPTLWIMDMKFEFDLAARAVDDIDFTKCSLDEVNVFETTIRYLGGLLSAYDLGGRRYTLLLNKAIDLGDMLYHAFDTPNRMPVTRWKFKEAFNGTNQVASNFTLSAEIGSLTLEFTRLSQITGDAKYYDAVHRIMQHFDSQQAKTKLPGMWPIVVNAQEADFANHTIFGIGGMADSLYEYLPKQYILLGGGADQYRKLYLDAFETMKNHIFYRPMTTENYDILLPGLIESNGTANISQLVPESKAEHLACFSGGMVALGAKIFQSEDDLDVAKKLTEGCMWGYETAKQGIMPEDMLTIPCKDPKNCPWDEAAWQSAVVKEQGKDESLESVKARLPPGVTKVTDARYLLRPEAIESMYYLYRITGDRRIQDRAWDMFTNITKRTETSIAHAALIDCTVPNPIHDDTMESFWLSGTLRYFYLIFSDPGVISLDEWVLNTEAHPLKRPMPQESW